MTTSEIYKKLDDTLQDKFEGKLGAKAFREASVIVFMLATHHVVKMRLTPQQEEELDDLWYGSLSPTHPLHKVRGWVQEKLEIGVSTSTTSPEAICKISSNGLMTKYPT